MVKEEVTSLITQYIDQGFIVYTRPKEADDPAILVLYKSSEKRFTVIALTNEPGKYTVKDMWLTIAESKTEVFTKMMVPAYKVGRDEKGMWKIG